MAATTSKTSKPRKSDLIANRMASLSGFLDGATVAPGLPTCTTVTTGNPAPTIQAKGAPKPTTATRSDRTRAVTVQGTPPSAGSVINALLERPQGATLDEMVTALSALPRYQGKPAQAKAKATSHPKTVASYAFTVTGKQGLVTVDPENRYRCKDATRWHVLAHGGKCAGGVIVRVDSNGKPVTATSKGKVTA